MNARLSADRTPLYRHTPLFPLGKDETPYRKLSADGLCVERALGEDVLVIPREALRALAEAAFTDINHLLRPAHLASLKHIVEDPEASDNDKFVACDFLKNANIAAGGVLPMCQDTGTAIIMGKKGRLIWTEGDDEAALAEGARDAYLKRNLRYSQLAPISMFEEKNTRSNMPAQVEIYAEGAGEGDAAYKFLFIAKGGGSANKSFLFQATPAILSRERMLAFLKEKVLTLGTAACPPYHLAIVIGGTSAELTMKTVKLASCRYYDALPERGSEDGHAFRDREMEHEIHKMTQALGVGAQFGGKYFCHDVRVIRLPRHGASLPIGLGVSCAADRQALGKITRDGVFLEELEHNPAKYLPEVDTQKLGGEMVQIDLNRPMQEILAQLTKYPIKTRLSLSGTMIVARDAAHAKLRERLEKGTGLPDYFKNHPVYYAGPAKTPEGYASGAFGPTTAGRMDSFVEDFQAAGGSLVMLAKGNRAGAVREACRKHGGFYLASIGGAAANLAEHCIKKVECIEYPELGMEAIWRIEVVDFPAFIVVDDKGNDFFQELNLGSTSRLSAEANRQTLSRTFMQQKAQPRRPLVWRDMDQQALDRAYDQGVYAPNRDQVLGRIAAASERARKALGVPQRVAYGPSGQERLDIYRAAAPAHSTAASGRAKRGAPVNVFVHGGAWRGSSAAESAFTAEALVAAGAHAVIIDFINVDQVGGDLTPIYRQVSGALAWVWRNAKRFGGDPDRLFVSAHSSGAHLAACALTTGWREEGLPPSFCKGALLIGGMYDLAPVRLSSRSTYVAFTDAMEQSLSPIRHVEGLAAPLILAHGTVESPEFQRQTRDFVASVTAAGKPAELFVGKGYDHFDLFETLANPYGLLGRARLRQMGLGALR